MRMIFYLAVISLSLTVFDRVADASVLGSRYIGVGVGVTWIGEMFSDDRYPDTIFDKTSTDYRAGIRLPLGHHLDIVGSIDYSKYEGNYQMQGDSYDSELERKVFRTEIEYHFLPKRRINPFIGTGVIYVRHEETIHKLWEDMGGFSRGGAALGFKVSAGAEINIQDTVSVLLWGAYQSEEQDSFFTSGYHDEDYLASASLDVWVGKMLLVRIGAGHDFIDESTTASLTAALGF